MDNQYDVADCIVQRVAELPDRSSPDDWPEAMLVTAEELRRIVREEIEARAPIVIADQWCGNAV